MSESRVVVVHPHEADASQTTPGMEFRHSSSAIAGGSAGLAGSATTPATRVAGITTHNDTYVYVIRGSVTFDFGSSGAQRVVARAGDFVSVPARSTHHVTTSQDADLEAFVLRVGGAPEHVNVDGPEAAG